jgi:hypothetical protein
MADLPMTEAPAQTTHDRVPFVEVFTGDPNITANEESQPQDDSTPNSKD